MKFLETGAGQYNTAFKKMVNTNPTDSALKELGNELKISLSNMKLTIIVLIKLNRDEL